MHPDYKIQGWFNEDLTPEVQEWFDPDLVGSLTAVNAVRDPLFANQRKGWRAWLPDTSQSSSIALLATALVAAPFVTQPSPDTPFVKRIYSETSQSSPLTLLQLPTITGTLAYTNINDTSAASGEVGGSPFTYQPSSWAYARRIYSETSQGTPLALFPLPTITGTLARTNADDTSAATGAVGDPPPVIQPRLDAPYAKRIYADTSQGTPRMLAATSVEPTTVSRDALLANQRKGKVNSGGDTSQGTPIVLFVDQPPPVGDPFFSLPGLPTPPARRINGDTSQGTPHVLFYSGLPASQLESLPVPQRRAPYFNTSYGTPQVLFPAPEATGTVAYTNANDTSSANGTTTVTGTLARTNANDTSSSSGTTTVVGTVAVTNANDTSAASGTTTVTGTLARTNANDLSTASGFVGSVTGTVAVTNANDSSTSSSPSADAGGGGPDKSDDDRHGDRHRKYVKHLYGQKPPERPPAAAKSPVEARTPSKSSAPPAAAPAVGGLATVVPPETAPATEVDDEQDAMDAIAILIELKIL